MVATLRFILTPCHRPPAEQPTRNRCGRTFLGTHSTPQRLPLTVGGLFAAAVQLIARLSIKTDVTRLTIEPDQQRRQHDTAQAT